MPLATLLEQVSKSSASPNSILTDGQFTLSYAALPARLAEIGDYLRGQGIERNGCLAVECPNSLLGALPWANARPAND